MLQPIASAARSLAACVCIKEEGRWLRKQQDVLLRSGHLLASLVEWSQLAVDRCQFVRRHDNLYQFEAQANLRLPTQSNLQFEAQLKPHRPLLSTPSQQLLEEDDQVQSMDTTLTALQQAQMTYKSNYRGRQTQILNLNWKKRPLCMS